MTIYIGKGWPKGDHSERGAKVAEVIGKRFEEAGATRWTEEDTADVVWLVKEHLTMSDISQRRDVSDLMSKDCRQFIIVGSDFKQAAIDEDGPPGEAE